MSEPAPPEAGAGPMPPPPGPDDAEPADEWRRLSARMLLVHPVREVIRFLPAVVGLLIAGSARGGGQQWWWALAGAVGAIGLGLLRWFTTRYRFTDDQVLLRTGLFSRSTVTAPMDRVRSVDVTASPLHRVLGLAEVRIGTGAGEKELKLDGLASAQATALRHELLHRGSRHTGADHESPAGVIPAEVPEEELLRLDPRWVRYAPLGPSGLIAATAILGGGFQLIDQAGFDSERDRTVQHGWDPVSGLGVWLAVLVSVLVLAVFVTALSLVGYVLLYWRFRLTRHLQGGTLHVTRGLLTTRATTLEERRLRGLVLQESLALRLGRAARLEAVTTGLKSDGNKQSAMLAPPAPRDVVRALAERVLRAPGVLTTPLTSHGPAARRRRYTRALLGGALIGAAAGVGGYVVQQWLVVLAVVPLLLALLLAADRSRSLAHGLDERYLVSRAGSLVRHTDVVQRDGVLGVTLRRTFFQRRAGLTTVVVPTAAGDQAYDVTDVPDDAAVALAAALLPGHLEPFTR